MPQIQPGETFAIGQQFTASRANNHVAGASLLPGAITEQTNIPATDVQADDKLLVYDNSASALKKVDIGNVINSGIPVSISDGPVVTASGYSYITGNIVTVNSAAHGLSTNDYVEITCVSTSGDSGDKFSGRFLVTVVDLNSYTYNVYGIVTASSGNCTWKKSGKLDVNASIKVNTDLIVNGEVKINSTKSVLLPSGTTAQRPISPKIAEFRYNNQTQKPELWDGLVWDAVAMKQKAAYLHVKTSTGNYNYVNANVWHPIAFTSIQETDTFVVNSASFTYPSGTSDITLPAGTYTINGDATLGLKYTSNNAHYVANLKIRLFNQTDNIEIVSSPNVIASREFASFYAFAWDTTGYSNTQQNYLYQIDMNQHNTTTLRGVFKLTSQATVRIQYFQTGTAANSFYRTTDDFAATAVMFPVVITKID